jgi:shikimate dehydrogenase
LPLRPEQLSASQIVVDLPYAGRPTGLFEAAGEAGATTVDGIEVLARQGAVSFRIWTGREAPLEVMRAAAQS